MAIQFRIRVEAAEPVDIQQLNDRDYRILVAKMPVRTIGTAQLCVQKMIEHIKVYRENRGQNNSVDVVTISEVAPAPAHNGGLITLAGTSARQEAGNLTGAFTRGSATTMASTLTLHSSARTTSNPPPAYRTTASNNTNSAPPPYSSSASTANLRINRT